MIASTVAAARVMVEVAVVAPGDRRTRSLPPLGALLLLMIVVVGRDAA